MAEFETASMASPLDEALIVVSQWFSVAMTPPYWCPGPHSDLCNGRPHSDASKRFRGFGIVRLPPPFMAEQGPYGILSSVFTVLPTLPLHVEERKALLAFLYHFKKIVAVGGYTHPYDEQGNALVRMGPEYDDAVVLINYQQYSLKMRKRDPNLVAV
jgi:hypothetical protein